MNRRWNAHRAWIEISVALGLASTKGQTVTDIASGMGITKQALSRGIVTFSRMSGLPPAYGLKSVEARQTYQRTNGHHGHTA